MPRFDFFSAGFKVLSISLFLLFFVAVENWAHTPMTPDPLLSPLMPGYADRAVRLLDFDIPAGTIDQIGLSSGNDAGIGSNKEEQRLWLLATALYERDEEECVKAYTEFIDKYPESPKAAYAKIKMGDYRFFNGNYGDAVIIYSDVDRVGLSQDLIDLTDYRKAYALLRTGHFDEARLIFSELDGLPDYHLPATYYLAYIDYAKGDFKKAYTGFEKTEKMLGGVSADGIEPLYYLTQLDYSKREYLKVIDEGNRLLKRGSSRDMTQGTRRVVGLSYFKENEYEPAARLLTTYLSDPDTPDSPDARYALGVIAYEREEYTQARKIFETLKDEEGEIAQSVALYFGQIALEEGNTDEAAIYFNKASELNYDPKVTEVALYNSIVARTQGGTVPFATTVPLLKRFISDFPDSEFTPDVEAYLAEAYFNEKNYAAALAELNKIKNPAPRIQTAHCKVLYELGVESLMEGKPAEARKYLSEALATGKDNDLKPQISLWLGDACYNLQDYPAALGQYENFLDSRQKGYNRTLALYDAGNAAMMMAEYNKAKRYFQDAIDANPPLHENLKQDAIIRLADCQYYTGDYTSARKGYEEAIKNNAAASDYAAFRRAEMYGLAGDTDRKLRDLEHFPVSYPNSPWIREALTEAAETRISLGHKDEATELYREIARIFPGSSDSRYTSLDNEALFNMASGLEARGAGSFEEAFEAYSELERRGDSYFSTLAYAGMMHTADNHEDIIKYANLVKGSAGLPAETIEEAQLIVASDQLEGLNMHEAEQTLRHLAENPQSLAGAKAAVTLGQHYLDIGNSDKALEVLKDFTDAGSQHSYWLARGFILLADTYRLRGRENLALEYIKSLKENYPGNELDIQDMIQTRLMKWQE